MAKEVSIELDEEEIMKEESKTLLQNEEPERKSNKMKKSKSFESEESSINCLRKEVLTVKFVPKQTGLVTNPKHILYGGMAENAVRWFTLPKLQSGMYVNALTDNEKAFLEEAMGLEYNALSIYKKVDNYWDNLMVRLTKQDNYLDLSNPEDYIKYKVLLANKDSIAPSLQELQDRPKATYQFVIIQEGEESQSSKKEMSATMQSYMKFGEIQNNEDIMRLIIEIIDGRPLAKTTKLDFLQQKVNQLIQADAKLFLKVVNDPLLDTKVLIKKSIEGGLISNRGGMLYLMSDGTPLCENGEEPTLSIAARFLSTPKRQEMKFALEAKLKS